MGKDKSKRLGRAQIIEIFRRMTWKQRVMYLVFPIVFLSIIFLDVRAILSLAMREMRKTGMLASDRVRDAVVEYMQTADDEVDHLARNVEYMQSQGATKEELVEYTGVQTDIISDVLKPDTTGLYGYIDGEYVDSLWTPTADFVPTERPWYIEAAQSPGELVYVSPYIDMHTGEATVTLAKMLSDNESVVALDITTDRLQTILNDLRVEDKNEYSMIVDEDGTIVAHPDVNKVGTNYATDGGELGAMIAAAVREGEQTEYICRDGDEQYVFMLSNIGGSWYAVAVTEISLLLNGVLPMILFSILFGVFGTIAVVTSSLRMAAGRIQQDDFSQSLKSLAEIYVSMHRINLKKNTYVHLNSSAETMKMIIGNQGGDASLVFRENISHLTDEDSKREMQEFLNFSTLNERLKNTETITAEYLSSTNRWRRARFIVSDRDSNGDVSNLFYVIEEIDQEKRMRDELINRSEVMEKARNMAEEARREAEEANLAKSNFLANMSHEIRTPINTVLGLDTMILREAKNELIREYAMDIQSAGQSLLSIVNDILDLSKIESGKMEIIPVDYDVASMLHDIVNMITPRASNKALDFHVNVDDTIPSRLMGDDVRIRQIIVNLLTNAVKYTHEGTVILSVHCDPVVDNRVRMYVSVQDTGIGIAEEDLEKLFQEFVRIEEKRNRNIEGTGLGINIVTRLLNLMGSNLEVQSVYGKGSNFHFVLEQEVTDPTPIENLEQKIRERVVEYEYSTDYVMPEVKLLVVDDNSMNRFVFRELLKDFECEIDEAEDGNTSIAKAAKEKYDIIFMDHMMPGMDGIEAFHKIREPEDGINHDTPVIILTANAISGAKERYMEEGFTDFLPKPIVPEKLEKMLGEMIPDEKKKPIDPEKKAAREEASSTNDTKKSEKDKLPEVEGIDWDYALLKLQKVDLLMNVISDLSRASNGDIGLLRKLYQNLELYDDEESFKAYRVKVHAMKSSSAMVGAVQVSSLARILEYAARDQDRKTVESLMNVFDREWTRLKRNLDYAFDLEVEDQRASRMECDLDVLLASLDQMADAVDELDFDTADDLISELKQYGYDEVGEQLLQELKDAVFNMDSDACADVVARWKEVLGQ